jgi:uncharacterized oligopeptide transporter (OPT) family protein
MSSEAESLSHADIAGVKPEGVSDLNVRSIGVGMIVALIMGASYPYIVLKLGFGPNVSVVAAFFGFIFLRILSRQYNRWENNIVETAGTAASQTAFMCILLAAFDLLTFQTKGEFATTLTPLQSFEWLTCAALLGVLVAAPLRQHYIVDEKLTYADGVAAGETLLVLDSKGAEGRKAVISMAIGTVTSAVHFIMREEAIVLKWLPDAWSWGNPLLQRMGFGLSWSQLSLGSGLLVGLRVNASMMLGGLLSWAIAPLVLTQLGWISAEPKRNDVLFWVMWPATGMLVAGGLTSLVLKWKVLIRTFKTLVDAKLAGGDFPLRWTLIGAGISATGLVIVQKVNLGIAPWLTIVSIIFSLPLMLVGLRVLGETNWGPISTLSNVMQAVFAGIVPGNLNANMVASGTTGTIATSSEAIMQDYRAGHMLGSTPRKLTIMQLIGVPIGAAAVSWMYPYLRDTYGIVGDNAKLGAPASARWAGFATILQKGVDALPPNAISALVIFAVLGIIFTVLEGKKELRGFVPSPAAIGIGMLVPFNVVSTMFLGGLGGWIWEKKDKKTFDTYSTPLASGLIAGEAIVAVIVPVLVAIGLAHVD